MEGQVVEQYYVDKADVLSSNKFELDSVKEAIARINKTVNWSKDNERIYSVIEGGNKFCYLAKLEDAIVGYVILREDGEAEDKHLHVSWIATDLLNSGIGTLLMHKVFQRNRKFGYPTLTLHFRKGSNQVKHFYEKIGHIEAVNYYIDEYDYSEHCRVTYEM